MFSYRTGFAFVVLTVTLAACRLSSAAPETAEEQALADFENDYCALFTPCCAKGGARTDSVVCKQNTTLPSAKVFDVALGKQCLSDYKPLLAGADACDAKPPAQPPSCVKAFGASGAQKVGDKCAYDTDCKLPETGTVSCQQLTAASPELKCQQQRPGKLGDANCVGTFDGDLREIPLPKDPGSFLTEGVLCDAKAGQYCSESRKCTQYAALGESCETTLCGRDGYCGPDKKCVTRVAYGSACTGSETCATSSSCVDGTCKEWQPVGSPCKVFGECKSRQCKGGRCAASREYESVCGANR